MVAGLAYGEHIRHAQQGGESIAGVPILRQDHMLYYARRCLDGVCIGAEPLCREPEGVPQKLYFLLSFFF
jgi:hypothetical protein